MWTRAVHNYRAGDGSSYTALYSTVQKSTLYCTVLKHKLYKEAHCNELYIEKH